MDWITSIKSFITVVDMNSFTKAAEKRFTSPAGISRHINWLEEHLKVPLLIRTTRSLQLTEEGKFFYQKAKLLLADLDETIQTLQKQQKILRGPLKITLPTSFGGFSPIIKLLYEFSAQYPDIEMNLDFSNQVRDLLAEGIDIAFRLAALTDSNYSSVELLSLQPGLFAAPSYLAKRGMPQSIEDLAQHNCIQHQYIGHMQWGFKQQQKVIVSGNVQSNVGQPLVELAKAGLGVIRTLESYVADEVKNNLLQPLLKEEWPEALMIYLVYRSDMNTPLRVKAFADFAKKGLKT